MSTGARPPTRRWPTCCTAALGPEPEPKPLIARLQPEAQRSAVWAALEDDIRMAARRLAAAEECRLATEFEVLWSMGATMDATADEVDPLRGRR